MRTTLQDLVADRPLRSSQPCPLERLDATVSQAQAQAADVEEDGSASRSAVEAALTTVSAELLGLEAERLRTKRRLIATLADASADDAAGADANALSERYRRVQELARELGSLAERLRARLQSTSGPSTLPPS